MLAAMHMRPRRNRLFPSLTAHKRRKYLLSSTFELLSRFHMYE